MTPRLLLALLNRHEEVERRKDHRAGVIAAAAQNAMGGVDGQALKPADFFPSLAAVEEAQTPESQAEALTFLAAIYGSDEQ